MKDIKYKEIIKRIDENLAEGKMFESAWYSYVIIEDRLVSLLNQTGGSTVRPKNRKKPPEPIKMLGPKIKALNERVKNDRILEAYLFEKTGAKRINILDTLTKWKNKRDTLVHQVANDDSMDIAKIDELAKETAIEGRELMRRLSAIARSVKKRKK